MGLKESICLVCFTAVTHSQVGYTWQVKAAHLYTQLSQVVTSPPLPSPLFLYGFLNLRPNVLSGRQVTPPRKPGQIKGVASNLPGSVYSH